MGTAAIQLVTSTGLNRNVDPATLVNPGDSIRVQDKTFPPEFWPTFLLSVCSVVLTGFVIFRK
jgi:hypothetical protein